MMQSLASDSQWVPVENPAPKAEQVDPRTQSVKASVKLEPYNPNAYLAQSLASDSDFVPLTPTPDAPSTTQLDEIQEIEEAKPEVEDSKPEIENTQLKNAISVGASFMSVPDMNTTEPEITPPRTNATCEDELKKLDDMLFSYLNDVPNKFK